ncbi:diadenosine tetraphosphate (Ap4A) HIT family hydrolase [Luteibacter sp. OK325]|uniref:HIT domain-containing protein n=1 Tax=Luteibacter sp. OK325 TaxID=2135670 RepID=UPI000D3947E5|nr:HIT family protein [Luteibacter sp. OK325]PTR32842.1 diadenosine tetraphosphate (Ap4A) HIT family hydrolase [Luteibacter sp. OK325]
MSAPFELDARLAGDTLVVGDLALCRVLLMRDSRFAWLVLVPRGSALVEVSDLAEDERALLWREVDAAGRALRALAPCDKLNIGALGNIVRQLHVHVVARRVDDAAWPGPVWGSGKAEAYAEGEAERLVEALRRKLL